MIDVKLYEPGDEIPNCTGAVAVLHQLIGPYGWGHLLCELPGGNRTARYVVWSTAPNGETYWGDYFYAIEVDTALERLEERIRKAA